MRPGRPVVSSIGCVRTQTGPLGPVMGVLVVARAATSAVAQWIPLIKEANQEFKNVAKEFVEESTAMAALESASAVAPELIHALEELFVQLFSVIRVAPNSALKKAYSELEILVDSYR